MRRPDENSEIQRGKLGRDADRAILEACDDDVPLSARGRVAHADRPSGPRDAPPARRSWRAGSASCRLRSPDARSAADRIMLATRQPVLRRFWYPVMPDVVPGKGATAFHPARPAPCSLVARRRPLRRAGRSLRPSLRRAQQGLARQAAPSSAPITAGPTTSRASACASRSGRMPARPGSRWSGASPAPNVTAMSGSPSTSRWRRSPIGRRSAIPATVASTSSTSRGPAPRCG